MQRNFCLTKQNILGKSEIKQAFDNVDTKLGTLNFTFLLSHRTHKEPGMCAILPKKALRKLLKEIFVEELLKNLFAYTKIS